MAKLRNCDSRMYPYQVLNISFKRQINKFNGVYIKYLTNYTWNKQKDMFGFTDVWV